MSDLYIRPARTDDVPVILQFVKDLAEYEKAAHEVKATEDMLHESLFGNRPDAHALVAEHKAQPVGFALYFYNFSTWLGRPGLYLEDIYVDPGVRGLGIGKAILARLASIAVERGCGRFEWSVLDWNEPSIRFYDSLGARAQKEWVPYRLTGQALIALAETAE